jgi:hypothetical protein
MTRRIAIDVTILVAGAAIMMIAGLSGALAGFPL